MTTLVLIPLTSTLPATLSPQSNHPIRMRVCCSGPNPLRSSLVCSNQRTKFGASHRNSLRLLSSRGEVFRMNDGLLMRDKLWGSRKRFVNRGFGLNDGGGGGGGGKFDGSDARVLGNIALGIGVTYLVLTGQLGWIFNALVSIWLIAFLIPIIGVGAFVWWAGQDMIESTCPNCGKDFQIFRSMINDDIQLCPFCSQPFSVSNSVSSDQSSSAVVDDEFVRHLSSERAGSGRSFNSSSKKSRKGKQRTSQAVVDVEAEVMDAD